MDGSTPLLSLIDEATISQIRMAICCERSANDVLEVLDNCMIGALAPRQENFHRSSRAQDELVATTNLLDDTIRRRLVREMRDEDLTMRQVAELGTSRLMDLHRIGPKSVEAIDEACKKLGLVLTP